MNHELVSKLKYVSCLSLEDQRPGTPDSVSSLGSSVSQQRQQQQQQMQQQQQIAAHSTAPPLPPGYVGTQNRATPPTFPNQLGSGPGTQGRVLTHPHSPYQPPQQTGPPMVHPQASKTR